MPLVFIRLSLSAFRLAAALALFLAAPGFSREVAFEAPADLGALSSGVADAEFVDLDRDGDLDLVVMDDWMGTPVTGQVSYYERDRSVAGVEFNHHYIINGDFNAVYAIDVGDIDRDGFPDLVVASQSVNGVLHLDWGENDGTPAAGAWSFHRIYSDSGGILVEAIWPDDALAGDFDSDGDLDVALAYGSEETLGDPDGRILVFVNDGSPTGADWDSYVVKDWIEFRRWFNLAAEDVDGDGNLDLVAYKGWDNWTSDFGNLVWYRNDGSPANGAWTGATITETAVAGGPLGLCAAIGDFDRNGALDAAVGLPEAATYPQLSWFVNDGTPIGSNWTPHAVNTPGSPCTIAGDLDLDGDPDLVTNWGSSDFFGTPGTTAWYENDGTPASGTWTTWSLGAGALEPEAAFDLDDDGDLDLLGSGWQENQTVHRSAKLLDEHVVTSFALGAFDVTTADLDGDGDLDLIAGSTDDDEVAWYRNDGTPLDGGWQGYIIGTANSVRAVAAGDLDGDGDLDLLSASYNDNTVAWYENTGTLSNWTKRVISSGAGGASDVVLGDFDRDGDLDVACAQFLDNEISWYRNNGASPPGFGAYFVDSTADAGPFALAVGDIDGDGYVDLSAVSSVDGRVTWYRGDATPTDGAWATYSIDYTLPEDPKDVALADLDRDGDLDALVAAYAGDTVYWYENDGPYVGAWSQHTVAYCPGARGLAAGDFDLDGDADVLMSCFDSDVVGLSASDGGSPPTFSLTSFVSSAGGARSVVGADLDRDGDLDAVSAQGGDDQIAWSENRGGQFRVVATTIAADPLTNDAVQGLFRALAVHLGRSGDEWMELAAVAVRLEETAGDPLSPFEAASLIDALQVYGDDGDSIFEPGVDSLLASSSVAGINAYGVVWVDLADYLLGAAIPPVSQRTFFVAVDLANPFLAAAPETLRVTLLTDDGSVCEGDDREHQIPLTLEWRPDVASATLSVFDDLFSDGFESGDSSRWSAVSP